MIELSMTEPQHANPQPDQDLPVIDPTVDLSLDEFDVVDDLQALADEVAESQEVTTEQLKKALIKSRKQIAELAEARRRDCRPAEIGHERSAGQSAVSASAGRTG